MPDFKFAKGFFTGILVTDCVVMAGVIYVVYQVVKASRHPYYTRRPYFRQKYSDDLCIRGYNK